MPIDSALIREVLVLASGVVYWGGVLYKAHRGRRRGAPAHLAPRGLKERVLWLGWLFIIAVWIGQPLAMLTGHASALVTPARPLFHAWGLALGALFVAAGHAGTYWSYAALGRWWRVGVDRGERGALVTGGPYSFIRHPIYAFQMLILLGAAFLLPTPLSLAALAASICCAYAKALDEEHYLSGLHGHAYAEYKRRTGRFLPRLIGG